MIQTPPGWRSSTLGELGKYHNGRAFKKSEWSDKGRPIIRIQNLTGSGTEHNYFAGEPEERYTARPGDLLVSWAATLGAYFWPGPEAVVNQHIFKVESYIDVKFHKYLLDYKLDELMQETHGSGMVHITRTRFDAVPVAVPPLEEQRRIVDILEDQLSRLEQAELLLAAVARRKSTLYRRVLRQSFDAVPEADRQPITDVARIINGHTPKGIVERSRPLPSPGAIPFFKVGDMNGTEGVALTIARTYVAPDDAAALGLRLAPEGTVVFPKRGGSIATNKKRVLAVQGSYDLNTMGVAPSSRLQSAYLFHWFETIDLSSLADGSNVPQINTPDVAGLTVPAPPLEHQAAVVERITDLRASLDLLRTDTLAARSAVLRRALLASAFSGRLGSSERRYVVGQETQDV